MSKKQKGTDKRQKKLLTLAFLSSVVMGIALLIANTAATLHADYWRDGTFSRWDTIDPLPFEAEEIVIVSPFEIVLADADGHLYRCESPWEDPDDCWQATTLVPQLEDGMYYAALTDPERLPDGSAISAQTSLWVREDGFSSRRYALTDSTTLRVWSNVIDARSEEAVRRLWIFVGIVLGIVALIRLWKGWVEGWVESR